MTAWVPIYACILRNNFIQYFYYINMPLKLILRHGIRRASADVGRTEALIFLLFKSYQTAISEVIKSKWKASIFWRLTRSIQYPYLALATRCRRANKLFNVTLKWSAETISLISMFSCYKMCTTLTYQINAKLFIHLVHSLVAVSKIVINVKII